MPPKKKKNPSKTIPPKEKKDNKQGKLSKAELDLQKLVAALDDISSAVFGGTVHEKTKKGLEIGYKKGAITFSSLQSEPLKPGMAVFSKEGKMSLWGTIVTVEEDTVTLDNNTKPLKKNRGEKWFAIQDKKYSVPMLWFVRLEYIEDYDKVTTVFVAVNHSIVDVLKRGAPVPHQYLYEYKCLGPALPQDYGKGIIALTSDWCSWD